MKNNRNRILSILLLCCVLLTGLCLTASATGGTGDATLSGLEVSPGTLTPEFSSDIYEYQVEVGSECDKLLVNAKTTDSGAKMVIAGNDGLKAGSNTVLINVTAADGVTKAKYTITAIRGTGEASGQTEPAATGTSRSGENPANNPLAGPNIGGSGSADTSAEESRGTASQASAGTITTGGRTYTLSEPKEGLIPSGFIAVDVTIGDQTVKGWRFPDSSQADEFYLLYGTSETGRTAFYIYDVSEGTMITAPSGVLTMNQESQISQNQLKTAQSGYQKTLRVRLWIIIGLAVLCFILLIALTASVTKHRHRDETYDGGGDDDFYGDDYEDERDLSPRDRARRAYERGEESCSDYEDEDYYDLDEEPSDGHVWASTEEHAQTDRTAGAAPAPEPEALDEGIGEPEPLDDDFEELESLDEDFEEPEPLDEDFGELESLDGDFEEPEPLEEQSASAAYEDVELPVVEIPEELFDEAEAEQAAEVRQETEDGLDDDFDLFDLDLEAPEAGEPEDIPELIEDDVAEYTEESTGEPEEEIPEDEDDFEDLDLAESVPNEMEKDAERKAPAAGESRKPGKAAEESVIFDEDDNLDADFDLLEALLSDSVRSGKPEGRNSIINRAAEKAGRAGRKANDEKAPVNPVRELGRKKS